MSAGSILQPPRPDRGDGTTGEDRRLRGVPEDRKRLGASAHVHDVREDRLLRLIGEQACNRTWTRERGHPIIRSIEPGEEWTWCYIDEVAFALAPQ
jgi:hypothetical protein